jgi:hypothetical protein
MRTTLRALAIGCVILLAATACGRASDADTAAAVDRVKGGFEAQAGAVQAQGTQTAATGAALDAAAKELGVAPGQLTIDKIEAVQWNDAGLGCPAPGQTFAPAVTPGTRFMLSAPGRHVEVHSDTAGRLVVCQTPAQ